MPAATQRLADRDHDALRASLPPAETRRWVPRQKAAVVTAVRNGVLTLDEARARYRLTEEEFLSWQESLDQDGLDGLRTTRLAERRKALRRAVDEAGTINLSTGQVGCSIKDIGAHGARLELRASVSLPQTFELRCERNGRASWVSVIWRRGKSIGVRFETSSAAPTEVRSTIGDWLLGGDGS